MAKRRNGIYPRNTKTGIRYDVQVDLGPDSVTGKRRLRKKSFKSAKEAKAAQAAWLTEIAQGQVVDRSSRTVADMLRYLLDTKRTLSAKTLYDYQQTIDRHIIPALGKIAVQDVTTERIQTFYSSLLTAGVGSRTVRLCHMHLSSALKLAMSLKLLPSNPAALAKQPKERRREMHTWTQEEARRFLTVADQSRYGPIWTLAVGTGMRRGELLGLRWRDVDLNQGCLVVRQTIGVLHGRIDVKPPKTAHSRRTVPLTTSIVAALRDHLQRQMEQRQALGEIWQDHDLVFCLGDGRPINADNLANDFQGVIALAGVPRICIHDQRHTFVTIALQRGADVKAVSEVIGHKDIGITLGTYAHVMPNQRQDVVDKVGSGLSGDQDETPAEEHAGPGDEQTGPDEDQNAPSREPPDSL